MPDTTPTAPDLKPEPKPHDLGLDAGAVIFDGRPVGEIARNEVRFNLAWCRLAGMSIVIEDDPKVDRHRDGIVLARPVPERA